MINSMFKMWSLFALYLTVGSAWNVVRLRVGANTDQRFFTGLYVGDQNVSWSPTPGRGAETVHEWGADACGGRLILFIGTEPTQADSYQIPGDCEGKEYRFKVEESGGSLRLILRSIR